MMLTAKKIPSRALLLIALISAGACSWLKPKSEYDGVELTPPLTIPADLSKPRDRDALRIPAKSLIGANAVKTDIVRNFNVNMGISDAWKRLGQLLPAIEGVSMLNSVESISSHEVRYAGEIFLITAQDNAGKSRIVAIAVDGSISESQASGQLLAQLKAKF